jgi:hypothetical protein
MKKGKNVKLTGFRSCKVQFGTVDSKELKTIYINLQTWVEPKLDTENWNRIVLNMNRSFKHSVYNNIDKTIFDEKFIVDLDLRMSGIQLKKKSFLNLETTLFVNEPIDFKSPKLKKIIKKFVKDIYADVLTDNEHFKCYLTKNGNIKPTKVKTEIS